MFPWIFYNTCNIISVNIISSVDLLYYRYYLTYPKMSGSWNIWLNWARVSCELGGLLEEYRTTSVLPDSYLCGPQYHSQLKLSMADEVALVYSRCFDWRNWSVKRNTSVRISGFQSRFLSGNPRLNRLAPESDCSVGHSLQWDHSVSVS